MKKLKIIIPIVIIILTITFGVLGNTTTAKAANNECSADYTKKTYMNKINYTFSGNTLSFTGAQGLLYSTSLDSSRKAANADGTITINVPNNKLSDRIEVYFYLANDDGTCPANKEIGSNTIYASASSRNNLYDNAICVNYRNKWSNNETMRNAVSYCFEEETSVQYTYEEVSNWISTAESLYTSTNDDTSIKVDSNYKEVSNVKNPGTLTCDMFNDGNYDRPNKFYHIETNTENSCRVTCKEEIEVNFSDPVATQAGLCFQYLIEIKSKTECEAKYIAPLPSMPTVCVPTAYCNNGNGYESDKGGPTEDFDNCVKECDNGEYSQKCIDKCYNKVYKNKTSATTKKTTTANNETFKKADNLLSINNSDYNVSKVANGCLTPSSVDPYNESQIRALYEQHQRDPGGEYVGGVWKPSKTGCSSNIAQFYFTSLEKTRTTVYEVHGIYQDAFGTKKYCVGSNGFLTRCEQNGYTDWCNDTCEWVNKCGSNTVATETQAKEQYEQDLKEYRAAKAACESQKTDTCSNETTDYKIVVDNLDGNDSKSDKDKSDWQKEFSASQKLNKTSVTGQYPGMVTLVDGSCEDGESDPWHYHNIITFPGTWINNKTGQTVHAIQTGYDDFYTYIGNEYCTKLNSIPVNTAWYNWKVNQSGKALSEQEKSEIRSSTEMNIHGSIENYGYFGWNFDVECFYALIKDPEECQNDGDDCSKEGDSPTTDYKFRSVSLENLFPSSESGVTSRDAGFNWSCDATNLENNDYLVQPIAAIEKIQSLGESIYNGTDYLDYRVVLTPETMNKVRKYNNKAKSYDQPAGTSAEKSGEILTAGDNKTAGITVYKSYLLHNVLNSSELRKSGLIGCNNEDKGTCQGLETQNACYHEYQAQSNVLKGAK